MKAITRFLRRIAYYRAVRESLPMLPRRNAWTHAGILADPRMDG